MPVQGSHTDNTVVFDIGGQYHSLVERTVQKDASLVTDVDGDGALDFTRGYPLAGEVTSAGSLWVVSAGVEMTFGANPEARARKGRRDQERHQPGIVPVSAGPLGQEITGGGPPALQPLDKTGEAPEPEPTPDTPEIEPAEGGAEETP